MYEKFLSIIANYNNLNEELMSPDIMDDIENMTNLSRKVKNMQEVYDIAKEYIEAYNNKKEAEEILNSVPDADMKELAEMQKDEANDKLSELEERAKIALLPKDENDDKNIYFEIRPAAGGEEAGLFAAELLRSYLLFAQKKGRKTEMVEEQMTEIGGVKRVVVKMSGENVYSKLKRESGVHRVQRIPETESQGRVHTSTITIAIMPEIDNVKITINEKDLEMETFAASSAGGQNANKNQTGVRIHHTPTGYFVAISDSKSQMKNKEKALNLLKAKIYQEEQAKKDAETRELRGDQIGSGDRSEKIRTYNFPQDRVTDHRIKHSWSNLPAIMSGELDDVFDTLNIENQAMLLTAVEKVD